MSVPEDKPVPQSDIPTTPVGRPSAGGKGEPSLVGRRVANYEVLEEIGRGGMGIVYRARDVDLDRDVALKILRPQLAEDPEFETRFVREAKMAAQLDHPNIVQVFSAGRADKLLFIAMQCVRGRTVADWVKERGKLTADTSLKIIRQAAEALEFAHQAGLVHRDIKSTNLMIDEKGRVKIMDFGLMRSRFKADMITQTGVYYGTPEYSSPEQCETREVDGRSDIYSLGVVLYEMLSGRIPHVAETPLALFKKITEEPPPTLEGVPQGVRNFVDRMMAKKKEDRYQSGAAVARDAARLLAGGRVKTARSRGRGSKGSPKAALALLVGGLAVVAVIIGIVLRSGGAPPPADPDTGQNPPPKVERMKVVVFDFPPGVPDEETAWYEIALSDLLITSLGQQAFLDVPSRDELLWKLRSLSLGEEIDDENRQILVRELNAHAYVSGRYYATGGKIVVTMHAYRLPDNRRLFTRKFEDTDLIGLVDKASAGIVKDFQGVADGLVSEKPAVSSVPSCQSLVLDRLAAVVEVEKLAERRGHPKDGTGAADLREEADEDKDQAGPVNGLKKAEPAREKKEGAATGQGFQEGKSDEGENRKTSAEEPEGNKKKAEGDALAKAPSEDPAHTGKGTGGGAGLGAYSDLDRLQQWYVNRQIVEKGGFGKREFDSLMEVLRDEIAGAEPAELEEYQARVADLKQVWTTEAQKQKKAALFFCPCRPGERHEHFGRCPHCRKFLVVKVEPAKTEKKKEEDVEKKKP